MIGAPPSQSTDWFDAFPLHPASQAVNAVCESWDVMTNKYRAKFHPKMKEPALTKALKAHVERVTAPEQGLLGMWAAESVINRIDLNTGEITEERRTDIVYGWNDDKTSIELVFEFKKLTRYKRSRKAYIGPEGLGRFVTGMYSKRQPIAAMVGILIDPHDKIVPPLRVDLEQPDAIAELCILPESSGKACQCPSTLFNSAEFDTTHERPPELAPSHGTIRVAHLFLKFQ